MATKSELLQKVWSEFKSAQTEEFAPPTTPTGKLAFPLLLPVGNGKHLPATKALLEATESYASLLRQNSAVLRSSFSVKEFANVVRVAFGRALDTIGVADSSIASDTVLGTLVETSVDEEIARRTQGAVLLVGCWLVEDASAYPLTIGPVTFTSRLDWLEIQEKSGMLSITTVRRLRKVWNGGRTRRRKSGWDEHKETAIVEAVSNCPVVCEVSTYGLSSDLMVQKGLLAARLAMAALSLLWGRPESALERMRLVYDGDVFLQHYAVRFDSGGFGSGSSTINLPMGQHSQDALKPFFEELQPTLEILGQAIAAFVNPHATVERPKIANALFLSLWWFHQACRESSNQMAVTAFSACLDALAAGGKAGGIKRLLAARLGFESSDSLMTDGRTTSVVIDAIYGGARSRFIHGSSTDYVEDWSSLRSTAEAVARLVLVQITYWLHKNAEIMEVKALQEP